MLKIYHFVQLEFGFPFLEQYKKFNKELSSNTDVTVIFSIKDFKPRSKWSLYVLKLNFERLVWQRNIKNRFKDFPFKIIFSDNVNSVGFMKSIDKGGLGVCSGFNQIFSKKLISQFEHCINIHPSILPYYRGPVPNYWCLKNKEKITGFTFHYMTEKIDEGKIIFQDVINIEKTDTENTLNIKIAEAAKKTLKEYYLTLIEGSIWKTQIIDACKIYHQTPNYLSFPI